MICDAPANVLHCHRFFLWLGSVAMLIVWHIAGGFHISNGLLKFKGEVVDVPKLHGKYMYFCFAFLCLCS